MIAPGSPVFSSVELEAESERLFRALLAVDCEPGRQWNLEACQRIAYGIPKDDFSCGAGWRWVDAATRGGASACGLAGKTGELVPGRQADFLILDRTGPEVMPSWDFAWELVRFYDRADILATVVDGAPLVINGNATRFDSQNFVKEHSATGADRVTASGIVRLHGPSVAHRI